MKFKITMAQGIKGAKGEGMKGGKTDFKIDFVGIGASKCGTTWLGHMLEGHPQLCMSVPKEVHYFNDLLAFRSFLKPNYDRGIKWYSKFFRHCSAKKLKGEITPRYSRDPVVAQRIYDHNPAIKILYCLRNPVERIWSQYQFATHFVGTENRPLLEAIREEPEYIEMSRYYVNLTRYLTVFPSEQIFIVWFDDIKNRPGDLMRDIFSFLGVNFDYKPVDMGEKSNMGRVSRFVHLQKGIRKLNYFLISLGLSGVIKKLKMYGLSKFMTRINSKPLEKMIIPEEAKKYIIDQLKDDIRQLEKLLNKDLSHWLA